MMLLYKTAMRYYHTMLKINIYIYTHIIIHNMALSANSIPLNPLVYHQVPS